MYARHWLQLELTVLNVKGDQKMWSNCFAFVRPLSFYIVSYYFFIEFACRNFYSPLYWPHTLMSRFKWHKNFTFDTYVLNFSYASRYGGLYVETTLFLHWQAGDSRRRFLSDCGSAVGIFPGQNTHKNVTFLISEIVWSLLYNEIMYKAKRGRFFIFYFCYFLLLWFQFLCVKYKQ